MAKAAPRELALAALARAVNDPVPKVLHGSRSKPGIFDSGAQAAREAARYCLEQDWLRATGEFAGRGRASKERYQITPAGIKEVLANAEPVVLLKESLAWLNNNAELLDGVKKQVDESFVALQCQKQLVSSLLGRMQPPDLEMTLQRFAAASRPAPSVPDSSSVEGPRQTSQSVPKEWLASIMKYLEEHRHRNPFGNCPLPELYHKVAEPLGLTIGQFHDGLRTLARERRIRLHPHTGAAYQLSEEQYALVAGQEIKYYVECLAGS